MIKHKGNYLRISTSVKLLAFPYQRTLILDENKSYPSGITKFMRSKEVLLGGLVVRRDEAMKVVKEYAY